MAKRNEQVLDRVRQELNRKPDLGSRALYEKLQDMDPAIKEGTLQQFHARYVLPIKRERAQQAGAGAPAARKQARPTEKRPPERPAAQPRGRATPAAADSGAERPLDREKVRAVFMQFAREFSEAETRTDIVQVLSKVDDYVERVVRQVK
jgi:hypothetical protein